jgi:ATP-binding cassette subfamily C (CFTR/MRP) protein 4
MMSFVLVTATAFMCMGLRDTLGAGMAGLSLVYVLQTTGQFQWTARQSAEVENQMTSVERLIECVVCGSFCT